MTKESVSALPWLIHELFGDVGKGGATTCFSEGSSEGVGAKAAEAGLFYRVEC